MSHGCPGLVYVMKIEVLMAFIISSTTAHVNTQRLDMTSRKSISFDQVGPEGDKGPVLL